MIVKIVDVTLLVMLLLVTAAAPGAALPRLAALRVGGAGEMTPAFAPDVFHYAVRCAQRQTLRVSAAADRGNVRLSRAGVPAPGAPADVSVRLAGDEDLVVALAAPGAAERAAYYVVRCVPPEFPDVEVLRMAPGRAPGLLLVTPYYNVPGADAPVSWLALLDDHGVPRFRRRVAPGAHNFRWHEHARRYSYNEARPNGAGAVVLLDERLAEVARVGPVGGLARRRCTSS